MLNTSSMAFSNLSYMTPTRTLARTGGTVASGGGSVSGSGHHRDCGADYFASSADFEYDLFLHGLVSCDNSAFSSSATTGGAGGNSSTTGSGFFSRYRSSRPFFGASSSSNSGASSLLSGRQSSHSMRSPTSSLMSAFSITSLNRSNFTEPYGLPDDRYGDVSASSSYQQQQQQRRSMLASNLSLGNFVPLNAAAVSAGTVTGRHAGIAEESNRGKHRLQPQPKRAHPVADQIDSENVDNLSHQQLHALHRFRRQKEKGFLSRLRDVVISFTPKARLSIVNRQDLFLRFGKEEKEALASFDYLDKLPAAAVSSMAPYRSSADGALDDEASAVSEEDLTLVSTHELLHEWEAAEVSRVLARPLPSCDTPSKGDATRTAPTTEDGISNKGEPNFDGFSGDRASTHAESTLEAAQECSLEEASLFATACPFSTSRSASGNNNNKGQSKKKSKQKTKAKAGKQTAKSR